MNVGDAGSGGWRRPLRSMLAGELASLAPAQRRLAEHLLERFASASDLTITELAAEAGVSVGTVSSLIRRCGLHGYRDLRFTLAREAVLAAPATGGTVEPGPEDAAGDAGSAIRRVADSNVSAVIETARGADPAALDEAARIILGARRIDCVGSATAGFVAQEAALKLRKLGLPACAAIDAHAQAMSAGTLGPGDALLAISRSGRTLDVLRCAEAVRDQHGRVIAITGSPASPLGRSADIVIATASYDRGFQVEPMASTIAQLTIVQVLFVLLLERGGERTAVHLARTQQVTEDRQVRGRQRR